MDSFVDFWVDFFSGFAKAASSMTVGESNVFTLILGAIVICMLIAFVFKSH